MHLYEKGNQIDIARIDRQSGNEVPPRCHETRASLETRVPAPPGCRDHHDPETVSVDRVVIYSIVNYCLSRNMWSMSMWCDQLRRAA